jgi:very-short-patch-repair endonuclease
MSEKAVRLIEYLIRIAHLRSRIIRDFSEYERVLWLHEIPHEKGCYTRLWGPEEEHDPDAWIEVQTAKEPKLPTVPKVCRDWVIEESLHLTTDIPALHDEITKQEPNPAWTKGSSELAFITKTEKLADYPEVTNTWQNYIEQNWMPWSLLHKKWETIHNVYSQLFTIHQEQKRLGEEYELVVALGLLCWQTPQNQHVRRHLITAKATLEFEASLGRFTVHPAREGAQLTIEMDMLDGEEHPAGAERAAKEGLQGAHDDPWEQAPIESVLKGLVHSIKPDGEYREVIEPASESISVKPIVQYAPALILRKRSIRGLTEILKNMKQSIEQGGRIPSEFADLAEISNTADPQDKPDDDLGSDMVDTEVYFPKPANDEQRRIIEKFRTASGILVQGPPGTGKSHTIANLICHLLATGHRVLVTAKTPRALQVLEKLLPEEIRPLCVNLLGQGIDEQRSLELSVGRILNKHDEWDREKLIRHGESEKIKAHLDELRREKVQLKRRIRDIRESETHTQVIADGAYRGTAAQIARNVRKNEPLFGWFDDPIPNGKECPFEVQYLTRFLTILRKLTPERRKDLSHLIPDPNNDLPPQEDFENTVRQEQQCCSQIEGLAPNSDKRIFDHLSSCTESDVRVFLESIKKLTDSITHLRSNNESWVSRCVQDILSGNHTHWGALGSLTSKSLDRYEAQKGLARIVSPENIKHTQLLEDSKILKTHLESGASLGWSVFRPKVVRQRRYILESVFVNSKQCRTLETILELVNSLELEEALQNSWDSWTQHLSGDNRPLDFQIVELKHRKDILAQAFELQTIVQQCKECLALCGNIPEPAWHDDSHLNKILVSCQRAIALFQKQSVTTKIESWENHLLDLSMRSNVHSVVNRSLQAIRARDGEELLRIKHDIDKLDKSAQAVRWADSFLKKIEEVTPRFARSLRETPNDSVWDSRLPQFCEAWKWAQAKSYLNDYLNKDDLPSFERRLHQIESDIGKYISELASFKAWSFCFKRMQEKHLRHLKAWQQAMKHATRKYSKVAPKWRREAQKNLNECVDVVPAWVMPLHRVWDTVDPSPEMFDTIIVDEASQCGPEALPLFYLGRKIIIVGDDKQISPDAVGVPLDPAYRLIEDYLHDFRFKMSFNINNSLFAHGELRYGTRRIALREHFRCMPEIIRFSNDLCYSGTPLIPLRQYPPNRLKPLEHVFIQNGYRQGSGANVINRPEAEAIAQRIVDCCSDPQYSDKTMGVVVLQGEQQAKLIESMLLERLGASEMENRRLICGNPYSFQGDERDVMFLSMVAATNEQIGVMSGDDDERRFNVAASRARDQMWLFHSVARNDLSTKCLRRRLLEFFEETQVQTIAGLDVDALRKAALIANRGIENPPSPFESWFEVDVALEIAGKGYRVIPQFKFAGKFIDLVIQGGHAQLAVECDGDEFHGADRYEQDMQRQRMLERCKWVFYRVRGSSFYMDPANALAPLWNLLEDRGIMPLSANTPDQPFSDDLQNMSKPEVGSSVVVKIDDTVRYMDLQNPNEILEVSISKGESNPDFGIVNERTPIARALLGTRVGEEVQAKLPTGTVSLKVLEIFSTK